MQLFDLCGRIAKIAYLFYLMNPTIFEQLHREGLLSGESLYKIKSEQDGRMISVRWELRTILYLGVLLLTTGLGVLVYKNIDTIGHVAILVFIALLSLAGFFYCTRKKLPFSTKKIQAPNSFFDYILLLACLCFIIFIGYWQYQYHVFGEQYGLLTGITLGMLFFSAYFFDHLGVLSMAITNLAAWVGIVATPARLFTEENGFNNPVLVLSAALLGAGLFITGRLSAQRNIKSHFEFTYLNFGMHLIYIAGLSAISYFDHLYFLFFILLAGVSVYFYYEAMKRKSFYFFLIMSLYMYIGFSLVVIRFLTTGIPESMNTIYLILLYFISSAMGMIYFMIQMNKKLKTS